MSTLIETEVSKSLFTISQSLSACTCICTNKSPGGAFGISFCPIPAGTQPNTVFNITGKGLPDRRTGGQGNVHVRINGVVPKNLDRTALNDIDRIRKENN